MKKLLTFIFILSCLNSFGQVTQQQLDAFDKVSTGTNSYSVTINAVTASTPYDGQKIWVRFTNANTGAATLKVNGAGTISYSAQAITLNGSALVANDIGANQYIGLVYYLAGTSWQLQRAGAGAAGVTSATGPLVITGGNISITANTFWETDGNTGLVDNTNFVGTTDDIPLTLKTNGVRAGRLTSSTFTESAVTFLGIEAGLSNTVNGDGNTFIGGKAGKANTDGIANVFVGFNSGTANITGEDNTFVGYKTGEQNTATGNTFIGNSAGKVTTTGEGNVFVGAYNGMTNTLGSFNSFLGTDAGRLNTIGTDNTFIGNEAGGVNIGGIENTFVGSSAGNANGSGSSNTNIGVSSGAFNTASSNNVYVGHSAGGTNTTGNNTFVGYNSGFNSSSSSNTFIGYNATSNAGKTNSTAIGANASVTASNALVLGSGVNVGIGTTAPTKLLQLGTSGTTLGTLGMAGNTSGMVTIQPLAAAGTYTITLPPDDGTANQFLKTDGNGITTWATGVTSVTGSGNIASSGGATPNITFTGVLPVANGGTNSTLGSWNLNGNTVVSEKFIGTIDNFDFPIRTNNIERMVVSAFGYVGIGSGALSPGAPLQVTETLTGGGTGVAVDITGLPADGGEAITGLSVVTRGEDAGGLSMGANTGIDVLVRNQSSVAGSTITGQNISWFYPTATGTGAPTTAKGIVITTPATIGGAGANPTISSTGIEIQNVGDASPVAIPNTYGLDIASQTGSTLNTNLRIGAGTATTLPIKLTTGALLTTPQQGGIEFLTDDAYLTTSALARHKIARVLTGSATLNFANLAAIGCEDLTLTVTGAVDGDEVALGVPNVSIVANSSYSAWVSAANTVTVRFCTFISGDPASGTFQATVIKN